MIWLCWYSSWLCVLIDIFWWQGSIEKGSQSVYLGTGPYQYYVNIDMISWYSILRPLVKGQSVAQFYHNLTSADWQTSSVWSPRIISECYLCWGQLSLGPGDWMRCKDGYHQHIHMNFKTMSACNITERQSIEWREQDLILNPGVHRNVSYDIETCCQKQLKCQCLEYWCEHLDYNKLVLSYQRNNYKFLH